MHMKPGKLALKAVAGKSQVFVALRGELVIGYEFIPQGSWITEKDNLTMPPKFHLRLS
jgi:hypothetical protein